MYNWQVFALLLGAMEIALGALIYMLSKAFNFSQAERHAKRFLFEAALTFSLVAFIVVLLQFTNIELKSYLFSPIQNQLSSKLGLTPQDIYNEYHVDLNSPIDYSVFIFKYYIKNCVKPMYDALYFLISAISLADKVKIISDSFEPFTAMSSLVLSTLTNFYKLFLHVYFWSFVGFKFLILLKYIAPLLIYLGVVLRAFEFTRGAGAYLMAFGASFFIFFPIIHVLTSYPYLDLSICKWLGKINSISEPLKATLYSGIGVAGMGGTLLTAIIGIGAGVAQSIFGLFGSSNISDMFIKTGPFVLYILCISPIVSFFLTMTLVNILTTLFGGRISEVGRGLFRFI